MARNLLIFSDGTSMVGGVRPDQTVSNIYKLYRACRTGPDSPIRRSEQLALYDAGLGANVDGSPLLAKPISSIRRVLSMALGAGITENVVDCYENILRYYQPGDRIFLLGFSRGAYTVRNVAGVLNLCGIPERLTEQGGDYPRDGAALRRIAAEAVNIYEHGASKERAAYEPERAIRAYRFRQQYGSWANRGDLASEDQHKSNVAPYFIGVLDTVAALGLGGVRRVLLLLLSLAGLVATAGLMGWVLAGLFSVSLPDGALIAGLALAAWVILHFGMTRLRVIHHYPEPDRPDIYWKRGSIGPTFNFRWHIVSWQARFFDRYLDNRTRFARHAVAIDEFRADFDRVPWGVKGDRAASRDLMSQQEPEWFRQVWFAGAHSDVGGGMSEAESGLPDIALAWMIEQLQELPDPVHIQLDKLHCEPDPLAVQHCAVDAILASYPGWWPASLRFSWTRGLRRVPVDAPLHPSVLERFRAGGVLHNGERRPYRPENLRQHVQVAHYYR